MSVHINDLTDREKYVLLKISYIDMDVGWMNQEGRDGRMTLAEMLDLAASNPEISEEKYREIIAVREEFQSLPKLHDILIIGYENHNRSGLITHDSRSGFVGYALEDSNGNRGYLFRGSETDSFADWGDNFSASMTGNSEQIEQAKEFFEKYQKDHPGGSVSLFGHSKGGNLASEVFVDHLDLDIQTYVVNGQPIYWYDLTDEQKAALRGARYTFHVHEGDFVSGIGYVDYIDKMIPVDEFSLDPIYPHSLTSVRFDENGNFQSSRPPNVFDYALQKYFEVSFLRLSIPNLVKAVAAKRYFYLVADGVKRIFIAVAKGAHDMVKSIIDNMVITFIQLGDWAKRKAHEFRTWVQSVAEAAKSFFEKLFGKAKSGAGVLLPMDEIRVHTAHLRNLAQRVQRAQQRVQSIDRKLNDLAFMARLDKMVNVAWIDIGFNYSGDLGRLANYLNIAADNFEHGERILLNQVYSN